MPRLKEAADDLDLEELESAEYSEGDFDTYDGPIPPKGTILTGYVKSMWWTRTQKDDPMLKVLWIAADNEGDREQYNGLPVWENAPLISAAKFRWAPMLDALGIKIREVATKLYVEPEDDQFGAPIEKIGTWVPGEDSDPAWCRILIKRENYQGETMARAGKWLPWENPADDESEPDEPEDVEDEAEDTDEEAEAAAPPRSARGRTAAKAAPSGNGKATGRTPTRPASATRPAATRGAANGRSAKATATTGRAKPATGGRRGARAQGSADDPPF
jgi:hypothetical protein